MPQGHAHGRGRAHGPAPAPTPTGRGRAGAHAHGPRPRRRPRPRAAAAPAPTPTGRGRAGAHARATFSGIPARAVLCASRTASGAAIARASERRPASTSNLCFGWRNFALWLAYQPDASRDSSGFPPGHGPLPAYDRLHRYLGAPARCGGRDGQDGDAAGRAAREPVRWRRRRAATAHGAGPPPLTAPGRRFAWAATAHGARPQIRAGPARPSVNRCNSDSIEFRSGRKLLAFRSVR